MTSRYNTIQKKDDNVNDGAICKIAIIHDFLVYHGGAERILQELIDMYPTASVYALLYDKEKMNDWFGHVKVQTSFLQKWPRWITKHHRWLIPFYGTAVESFDLRDFDLIISSSGAWSKGIVTRLHTKHVAYIHSPMRYVWDENEHYLKKNTGIKYKLCVRMLLSYLRVWDHQAGQRPDVLIANSLYTKQRIEKYYRRDAHIVYPVVERRELSAERITYDQKKHFLIISRLSAYKNVALAIEVCNKLQLPLMVIGEGNQEKNLKKIAGETVTILGWQEEEKKNRYLSEARALLFPSEDDFGIVCVEAIGAGVPVIALRKGGACEIVEDGVTGEFFNAPTVEMMADALRRFIEKEGTYDMEAMQKKSKQFSREKFRAEIIKIIHNATCGE